MGGFIWIKRDDKNVIFGSIQRHLFGYPLEKNDCTTLKKLCLRYEVILEGRTEQLTIRVVS